jgi:hypothetical protein
LGKENRKLDTRNWIWEGKTGNWILETGFGKVKRETGYSKLDLGR